MYGFKYGMYIGNPFVLFGGGAPRILDTYPTAKIAYSLRLLTNSYAGQCIRIRRASDDAELNVGFASGVVNQSAITSFCSGTDGFITTWYDQSGNANDATRVVTADQPKIHDSSTGVLVATNGKPAMLFDGSTDFFNVTSFDTVQQCTQLLIMSRASTGIISIGIGSSPAANAHPFLWFTNNTMYTGFGTTTIHDTAQTNTGDFIITTLRTSADDVKMWRNSTALTTRNYANTVVEINRLGNRAGFLHDGYMQEAIYWEADQESNQSAIETDANNFYSIF
jgi:hypothetical protein